MQRRPSAVVFDLDGVIVDSEPVHAAALAAVCQAHNVPFDGPGYVGWSDADALAAAFASAATPMHEAALPALLERKRRHYLDSIRSGRVRPYAGALSLIRALCAQGMPLALCSAAMRAEIDPTLQILGLTECFRVVIGCDDVPRTKPHPDPYLAVAAALSVEPSECLAIEDSPRGVDSACGARFTVWAVGHTTPNAGLGAAHAFHPTLPDLRAALLGLLDLPARPGR